MRVPKDDDKRLDLYTEVRAACLASREDRLTHYAQNRRWFLYGTGDGEEPSRSNKIYSHLDTVTSFLYAMDTTRFSIKLGQRANPTDYDRKESFANRVNEEWKSSNADLIWDVSVLFSLLYDSVFVKHIRRGRQLHPFYVDPACFGVYRDDVPMLDRQEAFAHVFYMTHSDLGRRLRFHPKRDDILKRVSETYSKKDTAEQMPQIMNLINMVQTQTNLIGEVNVPTQLMPDYKADIRVPLVEMCELWIWDDSIDDYRTVTMASDIACVYDRQNIFMPRNDAVRAWEPEHPFVQVCPNPLPDYFWGVAEVDRLIPLQMERNQIKANIARLQAKQVDPPSAWSGMGLNEDKLDAFNDPGANVNVGADGMAKRESYVPSIPADVYTSLHENDAAFDETSGLTNVLAGRGESGVRSSGHASKLASLGSSRPKKRALIIEDSLEKSATLYGKAMFLDDDDELHDEKGQKFIIAQMSPHFSVEVDAHSNSPVFAENQRENAAIMLKARAITRKRFIQMMAPPMQDDLIRDLETKIIPGEQAAARAQQEAVAKGESAKGKGGLSVVK